MKQCDELLMLLCGLLLLPSLALAQATDPVKLKVGMVAGIDMLALPIAVERGFFEKYGLDVTIARPYATGVDALNALQAGETDIVQVGVPIDRRHAARHGPGVLRQLQRQRHQARLRRHAWRSSPARTQASSRAT